MLEGPGVWSGVMGGGGGGDDVPFIRSIVQLLPPCVVKLVLDCLWDGFVVRVCEVLVQAENSAQCKR